MFRIGGAFLADAVNVRIQRFESRRERSLITDFLKIKKEGKFMSTTFEKDQPDFINKLPAITAAFWIMKIAATTLGETGGDWLSMTMNVGYLTSTLVFFTLFAVALTAQLLSKKHHSYLYWTVIIATSTAGTTMSDYMDRTLQLGYAKGALILVTILLCLLAAWRFSVGNVTVDNIRTRKAELFYWLTILLSNTLGTALGDFLADDSGLGFLGSWFLITSILGAILAATYFTKISKILLFWIAFILTRPFGATFGDLLTKTHEKGGLDLGTGRSSIILLGILIVAIEMSYKKIKPSGSGAIA
jgi:uncharacterized membrane-anchored protein